MPASVPSTPTGLSLTGGRQQITATCDAVTEDGGSPVTDYEMQIKLASVTEWGTTWTRIGLDRQHVFMGLLDNTAYDVRVRAVNAIGNSPPSVSVRVRTSLLLGIEAIDEQFIPLGTTDYDLVIDIIGDPDTVEAIGHMEGFNYDYDVANAQLHIRAAEVSRLIAGVFWTVKITKGTDILTADIAYNVVKAPPIFETLSMLHLYKDVPINIDILIQNIPNLIVPNARLLGLKSELQAYGMNIKEQLPADANLTVNEGDISMIVPSETGGTSEMHEYPYEIESGTPPAIVSPNWQPKGNYGTLTFADVNHALGYEWTLEMGDAAAWHFFNDTRNVINPSEVEVTPGNLNVTLKFPNVAGASSYEYRLEGENYERDWTRFVGTFNNGMITTIIPDLPEGETLTLRVRVASPWIGPAISIQVTGGRLAFVLNRDGESGSLYVFHTGVPNGATATRIKRILLPMTFIGTDASGIAVDGNDVYIINVEGRGEQALYKFDWTTVDDGARVTNARRNPLGGSFHANARCKGMGIRGDELYVALFNTSNFDWGPGISVVGKDQVDGASLLPTRKTPAVSINNNSGISLSDTTLFLINLQVVTVVLYDADFVDGEMLRASQLIRLLSTPSSTIGHTVRGHSVIGEAEKIYLLVNSEELVRFESDGSRYREVWRISLPSGLRDCYRVDISK